MYDERGYTICQENLYRVSGNFPRITENQIPIGVGDVRYSIVLSESEEWRINQETLFKRDKIAFYGKQRITKVLYRH